MSVSEIITDGGRRRHWGAAEKLRIVEETLDGRDSISVVARRNGVAPNLLYRWRRLMLEGGSVAVAGDDDVTSNRQVREMEHRIRELERQVGEPDLIGSRRLEVAGERVGCDRIAVAAVRRSGATRQGRQAPRPARRISRSTRDRLTRRPCRRRVAWTRGEP